MCSAVQDFVAVGTHAPCHYYMEKLEFSWAHRLSFYKHKDPAPYWFQHLPTKVHHTLVVLH